MSLMVIGDTHGRYALHAKLCKSAEQAGVCTIQLGDYGFSYDAFEQFGLSPDKHRFFPGNHDNYDLVKGCPNNLGDFGEVTLGEVTFFFVRGAFSIDHRLRTPGRDWWQAEELSMGECYKALEAYRQAKPQIMITHDCPNVMRDWFMQNGIGIATLNPIKSRTGQLLQQMYEAHQPDKWIFGHWHIDVSVSIGRTEFICLDELSTHRLGDQ